MSDSKRKPGERRNMDRAHFHSQGRGPMIRRSKQFPEKDGSSRLLKGTKCLVMDPDDDAWVPGVVISVSDDGGTYRVQYRTHVAMFAHDRVKPAVTVSETPPQLRARGLQSGQSPDANTSPSNHRGGFAEPSARRLDSAGALQGGVSPLKRGPLLSRARERDMSHTTITDATNLTDAGAGNSDDEVEDIK